VVVFEVDRANEVSYFSVESKRERLCHLLALDIVKLLSREEEVRKLLLTLNHVFELH
jgi:hypothetical protein